MRQYRIPEILIVVGILSIVVLAQSRTLTVERHDDRLCVSAPQLHFIVDKALEKLHNGSSITYVITLTAVPEHGRTPAYVLREQFVVSYDLWEEKYSVVLKGRNGRTVSRLTAEMAEAWCLENMPIPVQEVPEKKAFVIRLMCSIKESEWENGGKSSSGLTLANLIEVFSRKEKEEPPRWEATSGPIRVDSLKDVERSR